MIIPKGQSLHYNVDYMKQIIAIGLILILTSCSSINTRPNSLLTESTIPQQWNATGRMSINSLDTHHNAGFDIDFSNEYYQIQLTGALGLSQVNIENTSLGVFVNKKPIKTSLKQWMDKHLGWNIPVNKLDEIIFTNSVNIDPNWQINISSYQLINKRKYPRVVKLNNPHKSLKIKLVLSHINS